MARKSSWLESAQLDDPTVQPCAACAGTGYANKTPGPICSSCRGFGY